MSVSAIILTGGKNLRMGRNKSLEVVAGKTMLERVYERVRPLSEEVILVTSLSFTEIPVKGEFTIVTDVFPESGPLGGIYTGLMASHSEMNIVTGCDMPFISTNLLEHMIEVSEGFDAVVPLLDGEMKEPLHAIYAKRCAGIIRERLEQSQLSVHAFIDAVKVRYVGDEEIRQYDPDMTAFFDINYPSDLERASALASRLGI